MYYNAPPQTSPNVVHKLPNHHETQWGRSHHPGVLGAPTLTTTTANAYMYPNGSSMQHHTAPHTHAVPSHQPLVHTHQPTHHHQNSLSHAYPSPPNGHAHQPHMSQSSPPNVTIPVITQHWQQQMLKYDMIRASRSPHHRARQSALAARPTAKSAIPIADPNRQKLEETLEASAPNLDDRAAPENHPSSIMAPIASSQKAVKSQALETSWNSLDMGGINLKNIPRNSSLFSFTFLQNLYLNHNSLTSIPPEIASLKNLELLDISGNALSVLPPELGMLTSLKELYVFDNMLLTLPPQLGTLHQLRTIGIEGNPIDPNLKSIVQQEGSAALIAYLRDSGPIPVAPPSRIWKHLQSDAERKAQATDPTSETFSVLSYNILCERCATERLYGYTPAWALKWDYRKELILTEIMNYDADFLCLQEVDIAQYEDFFLQHLAQQDYEGVYWPRSKANTMEGSQRRLVDGCATFYKASKYRLVEKQLIEFNRAAMQRPDFKKTDDMFNRVLQRDHIAVVTLLENLQSGTRVILVNPYIYWHPAFCDVKLVQVALLLEEVEKIAARFARYPPRLPPTPTSPSDSNGATPASRPSPTYSDGTKIPLIIAGDFNSVPDSAVYELLANGSVASDHPDFMSHVYGNYTSEGLRHNLGLKNAYSSLGDVLLTNHTPSFSGAIDYIWYSANNLSVTSLLGEIDSEYLSRTVGFPNTHFPSDHVCIVSEFRVKPPKDTPVHPPPFFPSSNGSRSTSTS